MGKPTFDLCYSEEIINRRTDGYDFHALACLWTNRDQQKVFMTEYIGHKSEPGELKHLSNRRKGHQRDSVSSGERTRTSPVTIV